MDVKFNDLIQLITAHGNWGRSGVTPREALYMGFTEQVVVPAKTVVYETAVGGSMVVEFDEHGVVIGIEFV